MNPKIPIIRNQLTSVQDILAVLTYTKQFPPDLVRQCLDHMRQATALMQAVDNEVSGLQTETIQPS